MRWRERKLYRYRPEDLADQHRSSHRMTKAREEELRAIGDQWDESLREISGDPSIGPQRTLAEERTARRRRRRRRLFRGVLGAFFLRGLRRRRRGRYGRRRS